MKNKQTKTKTNLIAHILSLSAGDANRNNTPRSSLYTLSASPHACEPPCHARTQKPKDHK
jgi:hypothetical protein